MKSAGITFAYALVAVLHTVGVPWAQPRPLALPHAGARVAVDVDFAAGTIAAAWKADGSEIATQGAEGVAIRDAATLHLKRFFSAKTIDIDYSAYFNSPQLVAWCGENLVFEALAPDYNGGPVPASALFFPARIGGRLKRWPGARITPDRQTLYFSNLRGRFRILNFASQRWLSISLPLRERNSKPAQIDPGFPKNIDFWKAQITFSPDGKYAADQVGDGRMRLWNTKTAQVTATLRDKVASLAYPAVTAPVVWSPDGRHVATLGEDPSHFNVYFEEGPNDGSINEHAPVVKIWDAHTGKLQQWFGANQSDASDEIHLSWLDNDRLFAGAKQDFQVRSVRRRIKLTGPKMSQKVKISAPYAMAPDHSRVLASNRLFWLDKKRSGQPSKAIFPAPLAIKDVAWSRNGEFLAASFDKTDTGGVQVWRRDSRRGLVLANFGLAHSPMRIGWTRSDRVWSSDFYAVTFWNRHRNWRQEVWRAPRIGKSIFGDSSGPTAHGLFALSDDKTRLVLPDEGIGNEIYRWTVGKKKPQLLYKQAQSGGFGEIVSPDDRFLCFWENMNGDNIYLRLFDLKVPGRTLQLLHPDVKDREGNSQWELSPVFSRDGRRLAWGTRVWQLPAGKPLATRQHLSDGVALALNARGTAMLRGGPNGLQFFDPLTGKRTRQLAADADGITTGAWSPDGRFIALARRNVIEVYDVKRTALAATLYAWPAAAKPAARNTAQGRPEWLALASSGRFSGSAKARALVRTIR